MASLHSVLQSAAIGIPDEKTGELIKVFIVVKPGMTLTKDQVMAHMRANLTTYKAPKFNPEFRDSLPTAPTWAKFCVVSCETEKELRKLGLKSNLPEYNKAPHCGALLFTQCGSEPARERC